MTRSSMLLYLSGHGKQHESQQDKAFQEIIKKDLTKQNKCSNINSQRTDTTGESQNKFLIEEKKS